MNLDTIYIYLPERLSKALINSGLTNITEIRLRADAPASVTSFGENITFNERGERVTPRFGMVLTSKEINGCVNALCKYSRYSFEEAIKNGFIPLDGGCRAGVCGKMFSEGGRVISVAEITSVNIRLNTFKPDIAKKLSEKICKNGGGAIIYSPPGVGKTTYLKSVIHLLSTGKCGRALRVGVIDERLELGEGLVQMGLCDIVSGCTKSHGIELLTRTMSPEIIVCDEILKDESDAILKGCNSGVAFVCSVHAESFSGVIERGFTKPLIDAGIFKYSVGIEYSDGEYRYTETEI